MATSKRKPSVKAKPKASPPKADLDPRWSILLFGLGALLLLQAVIPGENGWAWMRQNLLFGTFGVSAWVLGPLVIFWAVLVSLQKPLFGWVIRSVVFMLVLSGLALVFGQQDFTGLSFWECIKALHAGGSQSWFSGGLLSLFFGWSLLSLFGRTAARALMILGFVVALMVFFSVTPGDIGRFIGRQAQRMPRPRGRTEEDEDAPPWEEAPAPAAHGRRKKAPPPPSMPALMPPARRRARAVDIDLGPAALAREEGLNDHDEVSIGPGGTFGLNPLGETGFPEDEPILPFGKFPAPDVFEEPAPASRMLLFGQDDPYRKLGGIDTKLSPGALPEVEYLGPPDAPEFDLFGAPPQQSGLAPAAPPLTQAPAVSPEPPPAVAAPPAAAPAPPAQTPPPVQTVATPADALVDAMIDRAAAEKASARRAEIPLGPVGEQGGIYCRPPLELFAPASSENHSGAKEEMKKTADLLVSTLGSFGVQTRILDVSRGPSVTRYEVQPQAGVKISKITGLADDIALNLAAAGVRIEAPIPGKPAVGIEVPNQNKTTVSIRSILESEAFRTADSPLPIALGMDIAGESVVADLTKMPHLLVAGSTGSGKSVCVNATIMSFLCRSGPEDLRLLLIDPKVVELAEYNGIPHLLMPVVTEPRKAAGALGSAVAEMERRYHLFAENNVRDIRTFNKLAQRMGELEKLPYIAIVIDELADLMMTAGKQVEDYICRIAQKARAAGMHLIVATQRPSVDVITGLIKANIPSRIAFAVSSQVDSRTILDGGGAEKLLGMGDMLFMPVGAPKPVRVQGTYVKDKEITEVLRYIKENSEVQYDEGMIEEMERRAAPEVSDEDDGEGGEDMMHDPVFIQAVETALEAGQISTSFLQRRLRLGYARAGRITDEMERLHIVSPPDGSKPRQVLISRQQWLEMSINNSD